MYNVRKYGQSFPDVSHFCDSKAGVAPDCQHSAGGSYKMAALLCFKFGLQLQYRDGWGI